VRLRDVAFDQDEGRSKKRYEHNRPFRVRQSGLYTLLLANCDALNRAPLSITGESRWMNPFGYLPGELYGLMPFFGVLASLYLLLCGTWLTLCLLHRKDLLRLQTWISIVLLLGLLESAVKLGDYLAWNASGHRHTGALGAGIVLGVTKRALSRTLVVMVSLGYAVVRPSLGVQLPHALGLGAAYACLALWYDLVVQLPAHRRLDSASGFAVSGPVVLAVLLALVDCAFYSWTFKALTSIISYLERKKEARKLLLFRRFQSVLLWSMVFSGAWGTFLTLEAAVHGFFEKHWQAQWSVSAVWEVLYVLVLGAIAFLWMPSENATRYAYSSQLRTDESSDDSSSDSDSGEAGGFEDGGFGRLGFGARRKNQRSQDDDDDDGTRPFEDPPALSRAFFRVSEQWQRVLCVRA